MGRNAWLGLGYQGSSALPQQVSWAGPSRNTLRHNGIHLIVCSPGSTTIVVVMVADR